MQTNNGESEMLNQTVTLFASASYFPEHYFFLIIAIAFVALIASKYYTDIEVLLSLIATIAFGISSWEASYVFTDEVSTAITNATSGELTTVYVQIVHPSSVLQIFLVVCFLFSLITTIYITFLRNADKVVDAEGARGRGEE